MSLCLLSFDILFTISTHLRVIILGNACLTAPINSKLLLKCMKNTFERRMYAQLYSTFTMCCCRCWITFTSHLNTNGGTRTGRYRGREISLHRSCEMTKLHFKGKYWHRSRGKPAFWDLTGTFDNLPTCTTCTSQTNQWCVMQKRGGTIDSCQLKQACLIPELHTFWCNHICWDKASSEALFQEEAAEGAQLKSLKMAESVASSLGGKWVTTPSVGG